jgi:peptide/nickel transport system permease protein
MQMSAQATVFSEANVRRGPLGASASLLRALLRFARRKPLGALGLLIILVMFTCAIFADQIAPYHYSKQNLAHSLEGPSSSHPLGTDELGRDQLSRIIYGARVSVFVGLGAVLASSVLAFTIGSTGYFGGTVDTIAQRLVDIWMAFPGLLILVTLIAIVGQGVPQMILLLGFSFAASSSRVVRSAILAIRNNPYFEAATVVGASNWRIMRSYVLPNVLPTIIVIGSVQLGAVILVESSLSFLGYGLPPPFPSWGQMLGGTARDRLIYNPSLSIWPGLAITLTVFGFNMAGDAIRDVLDPRMRGSR